MSIEPSDQELVSRARNGELDAFEALVRRYQSLAVRVAFLITGDPGDAEDVVQDAFVKAHQSLERVHVDSFRAWLLRIVANEARNQRKANRRLAAVLSKVSGGNLVGGSTASPEVAVLAEEQRIVILTALEGLREDDRLAISYRYFFDLSESEMVEALGWRRGTVKSRLARALVRMRGELGQLALLPPTIFALPLVARELAGWNQSQLEHGLAGLADHIAALPVRDVSAALLARLHAGAAGAPPRSTWSHAQTWLGAAATAVVVGVGALALTTAHPAQPTEAGPAAPTARSTIVFGSDLTDQERAQVAHALQTSDSDASRTLSRAEVLSTLSAAAMPATPDDETVSSVRVTCPSTEHAIEVQTQQITELPALTYATALLAAGSTDASVLVAAPSDRPVTGETALVGLLTASGQCQTGARVSLGYLVLRVTAQLASVTGDWSQAAAVVTDAMHAIVTGQARNADDIARVLQADDASLDSAMRQQLADELTSLVGQDYGSYASGYRVDAPSLAEARLVR